MWFFRQAQQTPPTSASVDDNDAARQSLAMQREVQAAPEIAVVKPEDMAVPAADWFADVVQPIERRAEPSSEGNALELLDKMGWWKDESVV